MAKLRGDFASSNSCLDKLRRWHLGKQVYGGGGDDGDDNNDDDDDDAE